VLLPDQLIEAPRPHPHRQRSVGWNDLSLAASFPSHIEQLVVHHERV
jgi:hypothetical protein